MSSSNPNPNPAARESAPYGQACAGCSKAKCRCISRGPGTSCERCHRLSRDCHSSAPVRKRIARRPANKTARLEEKLDDLVTLLKAQATGNPSRSQHSQDGPTSDHHSTNAERQPSTSISGHAVHSQHNGAILYISDTAVERGVSPRIPQVASLADPCHPSELSTAQAEECLSTFRAHHLQALPFFHIAPEVTYVRHLITHRVDFVVCHQEIKRTQGLMLYSPAQLQSRRPFLWRVLRTICCKSIVERGNLDNSIREILAQRILVDGDRSLDLLLGLIAYLAWYWLI